MLSVGRVAVVLLTAFHVVAAAAIVAFCSDSVPV